MTKDELIYLSIGGLDYVYCMGKCFHQEFFKLMKFTPGKALNYIKNKCTWYEKL